MLTVSGLRRISYAAIFDGERCAFDVAGECAADQCGGALGIGAGDGHGVDPALFRYRGWGVALRPAVLALGV
jgi:hypothetical protein